MTTMEQLFGLVAGVVSLVVIWGFCAMAFL